MNPVLYALSSTFDTLRTRSELLTAIAEVEDHFDAFDAIEQEAAEHLLEALNRKLTALPLA